MSVNLTKKEKNKVASLARRGVNHNVIANEFGISASSVPALRAWDTMRKNAKKLSNR